MLSLHAYLAGEKLYGYGFCEKPIFPYNKEQILFNYHGSWNIIEKVPPTQSQLK